jgi:hypothetical protein
MMEERGHRVVRLDDLTEPQRRLILALIDASREAPRDGQPDGQTIGNQLQQSPNRPADFREERLWIR